MRSARGAADFGARTLRRFVDADGTSHVRALAYESILIVLSGFIGVIGLASLLDAEWFRGVVVELDRAIAPGPAARLVGEAAARGAHAGSSAAVFGLAAAFATGTLAMAQVERSANRIAGLAVDRSPVRRYVVAALLAATVGVLLGLGGLLLGAGRAIASGVGWADEAETVWSIARWPIGLAVAALAVFILFRIAPRRQIGPPRAILAGSLVAVVMWAAFTGLLSLYFSIQTSSAYGSLLSIVALLIWSMLTSLALHLGLATACQLAAPRHRDRPGTRSSRVEAGTRSR
ncbi:MAG TPA: YihY/virulence factor BrkB family protein [Actinomycetota bacterium]|nr:YihY/virulence factor BrkB family protein [Actinomycetota bacterium]